MPLLSQLKRRVPTGLRHFARRPLPPSARRWVQGSFSQAGEDRIVAFIFGALGVARPTYLDIGAYHPFQLSNTALFHLKGSRGINVEPDPDSFRAFLRHRTRDVNLNVGVGTEPGYRTMYCMSAATLNTFSRDSAEQAIEESGGRYRIIGTVDIEVRTVAQILRDHGAAPDFLSLDVEGGDLEIVRTMPDWPELPTVVCAETITYSEHGRGVKIPELGEALSQVGYMPYADTYINTIFVRSDRWVGH
jgi:FkbM family methyltransferase